MLFTPEIITIYILDILFFLFATVALVLTIEIVRYWDANVTTSKQYELEKKSYLSATIIKYMLYIKVPLFLFFIYTLDSIAPLLPGAMCGAGVVNATIYATPLLFLKVINIYLFSYWILLDAEDMKLEEQPYMKLKFYLYILLYLLIISEIVLEIALFSSIDITSVVDCCGAIFSVNNGSYIASVLSISPHILLSLFYGLFILIVVSRYLKLVTLFSFFNLLYIFIALITLISFFGTYIYQLPTHHCPFCLLEKEYDYIGYLLYAVLFIGTFNGVVVSFIRLKQEALERKLNISVFFNFVYMVIVTAYPLFYYIENRVWL